MSVKKIAGLLMLGTAACTGAKAQTIPNGNFETWTTTGNIAIPQGWLTSDGSMLGCTPLSSNKTTDKAEGQFAIRLETGYCQAAASVHEGFALKVVPISNKPTYLQLKYKSGRATGSPAYVHVLMRKYVAGTGRVTVGETQYDITGAQTSFTSLSIPLNYSSQDMPDTAVIEFGSDKQLTPVTGNFLIVDDVKFASASTAIDPIDRETGYVLYPNPAADVLYLQFDQPSVKILSVAISDCSGKVVKKIDISHGAGQHHAIAIKDLFPGLYFLQVTDDKKNRLKPSLFSKL